MPEPFPDPNKPINCEKPEDPNATSKVAQAPEVTAEEQPAEKSE